MVYAHDDHYLMHSKFNSLLTEMISIGSEGTELMAHVSGI